MSIASVALRHLLAHDATPPGRDHHFRVSPPSVHQMVVTLERNGLIRRQPDAPRSIDLPILS